MNLVPTKSPGSALLVFVLTAILVVLGVLQYRSTQHVTDATARDMEESLQDALFDFRHGLENEFSRLCLALDSSQAGEPVVSPKEIARRMTQWRQSSSHPDLIGEAFLWDGEATSEPSRVTFTGVSPHVPWPSELADVPGELKSLLPASTVTPHAEPDADDLFPRNPSSRMSGDGGNDSDDKVPRSDYAAMNPRGRDLHGPKSPSSGEYSAGPQLGWMLDQERLVLLHPIIVAERHEVGRVVWLVVPLQREFLTHHLLPELTRRYFGARSQNYEVAVVIDGASSGVLYSTEPGFGFDQKAPIDARLNLLGPPALVAGSFAPRPGSLLIPTGEPDEDEPPLFVDPVLHVPKGPVISVIAQHRKGSLEAAVASLRARNLAVNFSVLGILAITLIMVAITSHRARALARMQIDFIAGVSHELRTPLAAILLAARNLEDGVVRQSGLARYGAAIKNQAAQLSYLVEEILLFTETHSGHHLYKIEPLDVRLGIQNTIESLAPLIDSSGVTVEEDIAPDLPMAEVDVSAFSHCLQNLLTNSLKYGGDSRWARVRAFAGDRNGEKEVCVSVEDRGIGIGSGELKQIFEPFYRSPEVVAAQIHGNGLGLPLTKSMVEAMGGRITVNSQVGKHTTFTLHLRPVQQVPRSNE
ncbi:MAG TPA: HAMP domain-containing sensor histidine kinase [Candidatus Sulfotelmatobacter sp.]